MAHRQLLRLTQDCYWWAVMGLLFPAFLHSKHFQGSAVVTCFWHMLLIFSSSYWKSNMFLLRRLVLNFNVLNLHFVSYCYQILRVWLMFIGTLPDWVLVCIWYNPQEGSQNGESTDDDEAPEISKWEPIVWLSIMTAWISFLSEYLVIAIEVLYSLCWFFLSLRLWCFLW